MADEVDIELEVVGRHAMLFDDDATSTFVNSKDALIEWNSLFIDRFDVRNLISDPPSSFRNLTNHVGPPPDSHLQSELDLLRYADLPSSSSSSPEQEMEAEVARTDSSGYHFVPFSYGNSAESYDKKNSDVTLNASVFHPPFSVPESLLQNLPPSEKVHQIIARTALFVGEHGGQSEIILRVKQGDNPTFGFLMPHHHLHPYFRYLVDHLELLKADHDGKPQEEKTSGDQTGGALSLLGSVYGTGEDEDGATVVGKESKQPENSAVGEMSGSHQLEHITGPRNVAGKDAIDPKVAHPSKLKALASSTHCINSIKSIKARIPKKDEDIVAASTGPVMDKSKALSLFPVSKVETSYVDPPSEVKKLVDRIVEIILKNGKDFEAVLIEQDKKHGRFSFLLPSNQFHQYYLKVLKKAQESRLNCKSYSTEKDVFSRQEMDKHTKESETSSMGSEIHDPTLDCDRKEKFKMVIGKLKKDSQDNHSKETQQQSKITVDTAAAAAILQAATRGIKKPNLDILTKTSLSSASHGSSNEGGQTSSLGSLPSSQHQTSSQRKKENEKSGITIPVAKEIAKTAALAAAGEADSSEAGMTREQKLKAERLRRAKMFAAMIKGGVAPLGTEAQYTISVEPSKTVVPSSAKKADGEIKDREGSSVPPEAETSNRIEMSVRNSSDDDIERKVEKKRHYRSRKHDDSEGEDKHEGREEKDEEEDDLRHSRKKHRSHESSSHHRDRSKSRHKHRRKHSSSRSKESRHRHKRESSSSLEDDDRYSTYKHDNSTDDEQKRHKRRHKHDTSDDESRHRKRKHKHSRTYEDKHKERSKSSERKSRRREAVELEEGEIITKSSDHSSSAIGDDTSTEISVDASKEKTSSVPPAETTEVPNELRAKIRAMLLATR